MRSAAGDFLFRQIAHFRIARIASAAIEVARFVVLLQRCDDRFELRVFAPNRGNGRCRRSRRDRPAAVRLPRDARPALPAYGAAKASSSCPDRCRSVVGESLISYRRSAARSSSASPRSAASRRPRSARAAGGWSACGRGIPAPACGSRPLASMLLAPSRARRRGCASASRAQSLSGFVLDGSACATQEALDLQFDDRFGFARGGLRASAGFPRSRGAGRRRCTGIRRRAPADARLRCRAARRCRAGTSAGAGARASAASRPCAR